ncbi:Uma2 family endonuclease [Planktothrix mougeotii]|uniref:Uma2 family endonuclease n=1 Tax=Planktothrix mougeotii LEGE 06226 TaxID=1828728 RepID=A0ABR9UFK0_9CYAN|nr:Uma2 family endonuclease [Planktothrix mougeotii]MBE9145238.1 Uma2 family endonuclease [Planktothrix mougeotii LEGE 06226]
MSANAELPYLTPQDYLEWETDQTLKYEYVNGEVFAMAGGTIPHNDIAVNLTTALKNHLRGKGCKVSLADAKVAVSETGPFYYPDVMVTCDSRDRTAIQFIQYPCLIVEVLSPSTEGYDRGTKFTHYRRISTLKEYLLINSQSINVDCFRLNEKGFWELHPYSETDKIDLTSLNFEFPLSLLYEDVVFPNP